MKHITSRPALLIALLSALVAQFSALHGSSKETGERWTIEEAKAWREKTGWLCGANFQPSTAINQLEMWQSETFDPLTIDRELGYAASIGFNAMRVYLHHLAWKQDPAGFKKRVDEYLSIADNHGIRTILVFFDDCWNATYEAGKQPEPKPGIHNSGWVQDPGPIIHENESLYPMLEEYVKDVMERFSNDERVVFWDLYNEPGNNGYANKSMPLLRSVFNWAREVDPAQPISVGVWHEELKDLNEYQLEHSDIVTYHNYSDPETHRKRIEQLESHGRPMVCTEYMARTKDSTFLNTLPLLHEEGVGAINWGLVSGKTNTIYAWDAPIPDGSEPELWFHDVFRKDGTPYKPEEAALIKKLASQKKQR